MQEARAVVLVVEDNSALRRLMVRMLTKHGLTARDASSAKQGLAIFEELQGEIDLAILDLVMPGMSGLDLGAEFSRLRPSLKVLYVSGYVNSVAIQSMRKLAPETILGKPFTERELVDRVELLCGLPPG